MRTLLCREYAPIDELKLEEVAKPHANDGQVLIRTIAAGVNFYDTLIVQGLYQVKPPLPFVPGGEVAGVVAEIGDDVDAVSPGDRVMAFATYGGYAEYALAPASQVWKLPQEVDFETAAAGLVTCGTAWFGLMDLAKLLPQESVLVLGAAGGVGLAAIQVATMAGADVIAAAGDKQRLDLCRKAGAVQVINYREENLKDRLVELAPRGVDVVVDLVGGQFSEPVLRSMAWRGRYLVVGFASGDIPKFPAHLILLKGCQVLGVFWDELLRRESDNARQQIDSICSAWSRGELCPLHVTERSLDEAAAALEALVGRRISGKQIIRIGDA